MSRLGRDPEDAVRQQITAMRQDLDALRQPQAFGASNVRVYRLFNTSSNADVTLANLTSTPRCIEVMLTPTTPVSNPAIAFDFAFTAVYSPNVGTYYSSIALPPVNGVQKFRAYFALATSGSVNAAIRFTFWTISPATYSAVEIPA